MTEPTGIDAFLAAVTRDVGPPSVLQEHALRVAAKKIRLSVESGRAPEASDWVELFPDERVRSLATRLLSDVSIMDLDFEATVYGAVPRRPVAVESGTDTDPDHSPGRQPDTAAHTVSTSPEAIQRAWHSLLTGIPDEGLPRDDGAGLASSLELGRLVLQVSQAKGRVKWEQLPVASGFRDRFVAVARAAGRENLIDGLPGSMP